MSQAPQNMKDPVFDQITPLFEESKRLHESIPGLRRAALARLKTRFPSLKYQTWSGLQSGIQHDKVPREVAEAFAAEDAVIRKTERRAWQAREEAKRLIALRNSLDTRKELDPKLDPIPQGPFPKIRQCTQYPLRASCNYGENESSKWNRCKYMEYDNSQSILSPNRWTCTAPKSEVSP